MARYKPVNPWIHCDNDDDDDDDDDDEEWLLRNGWPAQGI